MRGICLALIFDLLLIAVISIAVCLAAIIILSLGYEYDVHVKTAVSSRWSSLRLSSFNILGYLSFLVAVAFFSAVAFSWLTGQIDFEPFHIIVSPIFGTIIGGVAVHLIKKALDHKRSSEND